MTDGAGYLKISLPTGGIARRLILGRSLIASAETGKKS
jgi:hypothetical protein